MAPRKYTVRVDDSHAQWRYEIAARALWGWGVGLPSFFILCTEYVLRHHGGLKEVRRTIRQVEAEMRKEKRRRALEEKREKREALKRWKGPKVLP
jgi:hypothetical protein